MAGAQRIGWLLLRLFENQREGSEGSWVLSSGRKIGQRGRKNPAQLPFARSKEMRTLRLVSGQRRDVSQALQWSIESLGAGGPDSSLTFQDWFLQSSSRTGPPTRRLSLLPQWQAYFLPLCHLGSPRGCSFYGQEASCRIEGLLFQIQTPATVTSTTTAPTQLLNQDVRATIHTDNTGFLSSARSLASRPLELPGMRP